VIRHWLALFAVASVVMLIVLAWGYPSAVGLFVQYNSPASKWCHEWSVVTEDGRVKAMWLGYSVASGPSLQPRWYHHWIYPTRGRLRAPSMKHSLWEFDAHTHKGGWMQMSFSIFACPIWCCALPCLVAPLLWLRKRRKNRDQGPGFAVVAATASD
jgi:hypothetical protein